MIKTLKASAGTGKTYRLSLEYVYSIINGDKFEEIVVMTFTRKATAEIRERIFEHLEDILENEKDSEVYKNLKDIHSDIELDIEYVYKIYEKMIKNKDKINIYTIDSFINRIFKKAVAPYLGIYNYEIVEDNENDEIIEMVFKRVLDNKNDFVQLERFLTATVDRKIDKYISLIKSIVNERWKFLLLNDEKREKISYKSPVRLLEETIYYLKKIAEEKGRDVNELLIKDYKDLIPDYLNTENSEIKLTKILKNKDLFFKKSFWHGNKIKGKTVKEIRSNMKDSFLLFKNNLAAYIFNEEMIPYEKDIFDFYHRIFEIYDKIKFREKKFTHTDISNYTYKFFKNEDLSLIKTNKNSFEELVSNYFYELLGNKVKNLFIDEFQDTSILQWKILLPLIRSSENLITVGDEKQSIYGWRGGEKELFANLENIIGGKTESLNICYRSEKEILNFVNDFFMNIEKDWKYNKVNHLPEKNEGYVELLLGGNKCKKNTDTKTFRNMSEEKQIKYKKMNKNIVSNLKEKITEKISEELNSEGDIGILARTSKDLNEIAYELDKNNISYIHENKNSILEHKAIRGIYFLLLYLNYGDYFNLIRFLRSDIIGINSNELKLLLKNKSMVEEYLNNLQQELKKSFDIKNINNTFEFESKLNNYIVSIKKKKEDINLNYLEKIFETIIRLNKINFNLLSTKIFKIFNIMDIYDNNNGVSKNIYKFFTLMNEHGSLGEFIEFIEKNKENDILKQAELKNDNAVKLMTIHKAKGLSFETVFYYWSPGGNRGRSTVDLNLYVDFDNNYEKITDYLLTNSNYKKYFEYLNFDFAEKEDKKSLMEEINNLYVALTRAKKNLFLYIEGPRGLKVNPNSLIWADNDNYGFYEKALLKASKSECLNELIYGKKYGSLYFSEEKYKKEKRQEKTDYKKIMEFKNLNSYFKTTKENQKELMNLNNNKLYINGIQLEKDKTIGLAIHYYLEHIEYGTEDELKYANKVVKNRYGNILGPNKIKEVIKKTENFIKNNNYYFSEKWNIFNEYELEDKENKYRIDRLLIDEKDKTILIIDYKTGNKKERKQLDNYKKIIKNKLNENNMSVYAVKTKFLEI